MLTNAANSSTNRPAKELQLPPCQFVSSDLISDCLSGPLTFPANNEKRSMNTLELIGENMLIGTGRVKTFDCLVPLLLVVEWMWLLLACNVHDFAFSQQTWLLSSLHNSHELFSNNQPIRSFFPPAFHPQIVSQAGFDLQGNGLALDITSWPFPSGVGFPIRLLELWTRKRRDHHNHLETCQQTESTTWSCGFFVVKSCLRKRLMLVGMHTHHIHMYDVLTYVKSVSYFLKYTLYMLYLAIYVCKCPQRISGPMWPVTESFFRNTSIFYINHIEISDTHGSMHTNRFSEVWWSLYLKQGTVDGEKIWLTTWDGQSIIIHGVSFVNLGFHAITPKPWETDDILHWFNHSTLFFWGDHIFHLSTPPEKKDLLESKTH